MKLIQRLCAPKNFDNPFSFGGGYVNGGLSEEAMNLLRPIFSFDYMGSAEFEWGALPKAFEKIANSELTSGKFKNVFYICQKDFVGIVEKIIIGLLEDEYKMNLKEFCGLKNSLEQENPKIRGWIELDEDFMFFVDEEMFNKTLSLFTE